MDVTGLSFAYDEGKCHEEASLSSVSLAPIRSRRGCIVEIAARPFDGCVVISLEDHGSLRRMGDNLDDTACVGAIATRSPERQSAWHRPSA
jgi:hypothetical protein